MWYDNRVAWDKDSYSGISVVNIPSKYIWLPDVGVMNGKSSTSFDFSSTSQSRIVINHRGVITWMHGAILDVTCPLDVSYFPFDEQICHIVVAPWHSTSDSLKIRTIQDGPVVDNSFLPNSNVSEWEIQDVNVTNNTYLSSFNSEYNYITINICLRRQPLYFIILVLVPFAMLSGLACLIFILDETGDRLSVALSLVLSMTMYVVIVSSNAPRSMRTLPVLGIYLLDQLGLLSCATVLAVISNKLRHYTPQIGMDINHHLCRSEKIPYHRSDNSAIIGDSVNINVKSDWPSSLQHPIAHKCTDSEQHKKRCCQIMPTTSTHATFSQTGIGRQLIDREDNKREEDKEQDKEDDEYEIWCQMKTKARPPLTNAIYSRHKKHLHTRNYKYSETEITSMKRDLKDTSLYQSEHNLSPEHREFEEVEHFRTKNLCHAYSQPYKQMHLQDSNEELKRTQNHRLLDHYGDRYNHGRMSLKIYKLKAKTSGIENGSLKEVLLRFWKCPVGGRLTKMWWKIRAYLKWLLHVGSIKHRQRLSTKMDRICMSCYLIFSVINAIVCLIIMPRLA